MTPDKPKMEPCPFCGEEPSRRISGGVTSVACATNLCPASGAWWLLELWSRRTPSPTAEAERRVVNAAKFQVAVLFDERQ